MLQKNSIGNRTQRDQFKKEKTQIFTWFSHRAYIHMEKEPRLYQGGHVKFFFFLFLGIERETCHDSGDGRGDSAAKEVESVLCNLLGCGLLFAFSSRSNHAGLEEDPFKHHIVFCKVEEHLGPHFLGHLESPINPMFTIQQDLWLYNWNKPIVLQFNYKDLHKSVKNLCTKY